MGGSSTLANNATTQLPAYGTVGEFAVTNNPGTRLNAATWTDKNGNLWLFGGDSFAAGNTPVQLNDLWEYVPATGQWAWIGGSNASGVNGGVSGTYGTISTASANNMPGSRSAEVTWVDQTGNLWLFGGFGYDSAGNQGYLNDLWEYSISNNEWTWVSGGSTVTSGSGLTGVYGTQGSAAAGNTPGSRSAAAAWRDGNGNFWLFGGNGFGATGTRGDLNDLWEFIPGQGWAWIEGSTTTGSPSSGTAGGAASSSNIPSGRAGASVWTDSTGNLWLFGGAGAGSVGLNDLWEFNPTSKDWTWVSGTATAGQPGSWGTLGSEISSNAPSGRTGTYNWIDSNGTLWLYGGHGADSTGTPGYLEDLWAFDPSTKYWTWMGGSSIAGQSGVYGSLGVTASTNTPGGRYSASTWSNPNGTLWLYGGSTPTSGSNSISLGDLWQAGVPAATPVLSLATGNYSTTQTVGITDATTSAAIFYTTDGTTPTQASSLYNGSLTVDATQTIDAIAIAAGFINSPLASATYTLPTPTVATPSFSPGTGSYTTVQTVTISDATTAASIFYTTNGGTPTTGSTPYTVPISVAASETVRAIAVKNGYANSSVGTATYTMNLPAAATPVISPGAGTYVSAQTVVITDSTSNATIYYTTDGTTPRSTSPIYSGPITVSSNATVQAVAIAPGFSFGAPASAAYVITQPAADAPLFTPGTGTYAAAQSVILSDDTPGATIFYTTDGSIPTSLSPQYTAPITVTSSMTLRALAIATGYGASSLASATYALPASAGTASALDWVWISGSSSLSSGVSAQPSVYGTLGFFSGTNNPGGRVGSVGWTDSNGNLWLFGGQTYDASNALTAQNDLWEYNTATGQWAWIGGANTTGVSGVYGTLGVSAAGNTPGSRYGSTGWKDSNGHLWLMGGFGYDAAGVQGYLNDLWELDPATGLWIWQGGSSTTTANGGQAGVYGTLGTAAAANFPGSRSFAVSWTDASGNFWLFGGNGFDSTGTRGDLNDLWEYSSTSSQWTWVGGSNTVGANGGQPGVYGAATGNIPSGRAAASSWADNNGNFWLFGGAGPGSQGLNDLWKYVPSTNNWTWVSGSASPDQVGVYGTLGTAAGGNLPGGRIGANTWKDNNGNLWLFGGTGNDAVGATGLLNDFWAFNIASGQWAWMGGSRTSNPASTYGDLGSPDPASTPGGRSAALAWTDLGGNFWLFGGWNDPAVGGNNLMPNDLWEAGIPAATPTIAPATGSYTVAQNVTIWYSTAGSAIYYTLDGSTPTTNSTLYTDPITVSNSETVKAIAVALGYLNSPVASATYTLPYPATANPVIAPGSGSYTTTQTVSITDGTAGAVIYYTADGSTPTSNSAVYSAPLTISTPQTVRAIAIAPGYNPSGQAYATYSLNLGPAATPTFNLGTGTYTGAQTVTLSDTTPGAAIYFTTDGSTPTTKSVHYTASFTVSSSLTIKAVAVASGYSNSPVATATYTIQSNPTVSVKLSTCSISTLQGLSASIVVSAGPDNPMPTGTVVLTNGTYSSGSLTLVNGYVTTNIAAGVLAVGVDTLTAAYSPDTASQPNYFSGTGTATVTVNLPTSVISWSNPDSITYGTLLDSTQLNATTGVPGTFVYSPAAGTELTAGTHTLSVTFTPGASYSSYPVTYATVTLTVNAATPAITWPTPAQITYGTPLSATQLNATSTVAGNFSYSPAIGTVPTAGSQKLYATFTPNDTVNYKTTNVSVCLMVAKVTPVLTWTPPVPIPFGTALSATQLNATSAVAGTYSYYPASGTVLKAGAQTLYVNFTPTDTADYTTAILSVPLTVTSSAPAITWPTPAAIAYGTPLGNQQLNATTKAAGTYIYSPAAGALLKVGTQTLSLTFTPTDTVDYIPTTVTVQLVVNPATPPITWATPASITYGTPLGAVQLNASSTLVGTFVYTPAAGTVLNAGAQTLSVLFTPADTVNYSTATATVPLNVNTATSTITWPTPADIVYGTPLGSTQLNAICSVPGTFSYSPAAGTVLSAGAQRILATFTPTDLTTQSVVTAAVFVNVDKATPVIAWPTPAQVSTGTILSATQLNATASVPGTFVYSPAAGTTPAAGNDTLSVFFVPTDSVDYNTATGTVTLAVGVVAGPPPTITGISPGFITAGGSGFQLTVTGTGFNANSTVYWGTVALATQYVSATQLVASVRTSDIAIAGIVNVSVQNPAQVGGTSAALEFEVDTPVTTPVAPPVFTNVTASVAPGSTAVYPVTLPSATGQVVVTCLNLPAGASCSYSTSTRSVVIATSSNTPKGTYQITVVFTQAASTANAGGLLLPLLLLPLLCSKRVRTARRIWLNLSLGILLLAATITSIGCGAGILSSITGQQTSSGSVSLTIQ
jgi:N-acetylneuraminic acid mutarotase